MTQVPIDRDFDTPTERRSNLPQWTPRPTYTQVKPRATAMATAVKRTCNDLGICQLCEPACNGCHWPTEMATEMQCQPFMAGGKNYFAPGAIDGPGTAQSLQELHEWDRMLDISNWVICGLVLVALIALLSFTLGYFNPVPHFFDWLASLPLIRNLK